MDGSNSRMLAELIQDLQSLSLLPNGGLYGYDSDSLVTITMDGQVETLTRISVCGEITGSKLITPQTEGGYGCA